MLTTRKILLYARLYCERRIREIEDMEDLGDENIEQRIYELKVQLEEWKSQKTEIQNYYNAQLEFDTDNAESELWANH